MSRYWQDDVLEFMRAFDQETRARPGWPDAKGSAIGISLICEEIDELYTAFWQRDLPGTADAVIDLIYVLLGLLHRHGIDAAPLWDEVHRANMAKVDGPVREDGKKLKPEGWKPPAIGELLILQGWDRT